VTACRERSVILVPKPIESSKIPYATRDDKDPEELVNMTRVRSLLRQSDLPAVEGPGGVACFELNGHLFGPLLQTHGTAEKFTDPEVLRDYTAQRDYPQGSTCTDPESVADWVRSLTPEE
jgi:hypothetical protein